MDRVFDDFFAPFFNESWLAKETQWQPMVDVVEEEAQFRVNAELPGIDKKDIHVDVKNNVLTLRGERSEEKRDETGHYYRRERRFGSFTRRFNLPENVDPEAITADYKNGVLSITIPKPEKSVPKEITVH
ncbi:MAG: Hsp20/alpha crystallin family protein [Desulfosarcinaceae bacterium]|nr:Hsp20/alpha crystallin family protein [Desulfosarcinaceae bacterium]